MWLAFWAIPVVALTTLVALAGPVGADAAQRIVHPYRSFASRDQYRVGQLTGVVSARAVGYRRHRVSLGALRKHLHSSVIALSPTGRPVRLSTTKAGTRRPLAHPRRHRSLVLITRAQSTPAEDSPSVAGPTRPLAGCWTAFAAKGAWNTPLSATPTYAPNSASSVATMQPDTARLSSDPTQYTMPVYYADATTPSVTVTYTGWFSDVTNGGRTLNTYRHSGNLTRQRVQAPVPAGAAPGSGDDANVIIINRDTGDEWDMNSFTTTATGLQVSNVGHYNVAWTGVPPAASVNNGNPYWNNGAGVPLLGGLVRPCEIAQGHIDHALSFAFPATTPEFVFPAIKSDGKDPIASGMAEGTRLQLDPTIADATIHGWGCNGACFTIAKALQRYGMYVLNGSGRPKVQLEDDSTAHWGTTINANTVSPIPLSDFKALATH
jgi:hypothetical protein